ncbi:MAG: DUF4442 domain-containing protein [Proteobacteria bacterium]|nr:DUF4442 domain-containing protein [Pseudomonadota bacterium]
MLEHLFQKAQGSGVWLWLLNTALRFLIPFNAPHGIRITSLSADAITVALPFKRSNHNHVGGLHACALATASEFATGALLLQQLGDGYRLLMKSLQMEYLYQGRAGAIVQFKIAPDRIKNEIITPLQSSESVLIAVEARAVDTAGNHLSTAKVSWHIKQWGKVKELRE